MSFELLLPIRTVGHETTRARSRISCSRRSRPSRRAQAPHPRRIARSVASAQAFKQPRRRAGRDRWRRRATRPRRYHRHGRAAKGSSRAKSAGCSRASSTSATRSVREVMTPRPDIVAIQENATIGDLRALFREQEYSRFPVYKESLDNIAGFVVREGSRRARTPATTRGRLRSLLRPAVVVPETKRVPGAAQAVPAAAARSARSSSTNTAGRRAS